MRSLGAFEAKTRHGRPPVDLGSTIKALQRFSQGQTLEGLPAQELRDAGRR